MFERFFKLRLEEKIGNSAIEIVLLVELTWVAGSTA